MTLKENLTTMAEQDRKIENARMGYWKWDENDPSSCTRGTRCERIDRDTMKPLEPLCRIRGYNYTSGEFLGWVDNEINRGEGLEVVDYPQKEEA